MSVSLRQEGLCGFIVQAKSNTAIWGSHLFHQIIRSDLPWSVAGNTNEHWMAAVNWIQTVLKQYNTSFKLLLYDNLFLYVTIRWIQPHQWEAKPSIYVKASHEFVLITIRIPPQQGTSVAVRIWHNTATCIFFSPFFILVCIFYKTFDVLYSPDSLIIFCCCSVVPHGDVVM